MKSRWTENPRVFGPSPGTIQHKALQQCRALLLWASGRNLVPSGRLGQLRIQD